MRNNGSFHEYRPDYRPYGSPMQQYSRSPQVNPYPRSSIKREVSPSYLQTNQRMAYQHHQVPPPRSHLPHRPSMSHHVSMSHRTSPSQSYASPHLISQLGQDDFFSGETLQLLEQEDTNISAYRQVIEREKQKVANDFDYYIDNMRNMVEDNKAKFWTRLDCHYQDYVNQYLEFKRQVVFYKNIKNDILQQVMPQALNHSQDQSRMNNNPNGSRCNARLLQELFELKEKKDMGKVYQLIDKNQQEVMQIINGSTRRLTSMISQEHHYYNQSHFKDSMNSLIKSLKQAVQEQLAHIDQYVMALPNTEYDNHKATEINILEELDTNQNSHQQSIQSPMNYQAQNQQQMNQTQNQFMAQQKQTQQQMINQHQQNQTQINQQSHQSFTQQYHPPQTSQYGFGQLQTDKNFDILSDNSDDHKENQKDEHKNLFVQTGSLQPPETQLTPELPPRRFQYSHPQEMNKDEVMTFSTLPRQNTQDKTMSRDRRVQQVEWIGGAQGKSSEVVLCLQVVSQQEVVCGGKEGSVVVFRIQGQKWECFQSVAVHRGSICSMGVYRWQGIERVLTGSDHEESVVTILRVGDYSIEKQLRGHSAAIVGLQQMDSMIISSSYDQTVVVWSQRGEQLQCIQDHQTSISAICHLDDNLVVTDLDSQVYLYRMREGRLSRVTQSQTQCFICCLNVATLSLGAVSQQVVLAGDKQGTISVLHLQTMKVIHQFDYPEMGAVLELLVVAGPDADTQILSLHQSDDLVLTNLRDNSHKKIHKGAMHVEFGCGVDSKMQFLGGGHLVGVHQSRGAKCLAVLSIS